MAVIQKIWRRIKASLCSTGVGSSLRATKEVERDVTVLVLLFFLGIVAFSIGFEQIGRVFGTHDVAIIVVAQQGGLTLKNCLDAIQRHVPMRQVIVVDMSPGGDERRTVMEAIVADHPTHGTLLEDKGNRGWSGSLNAAVMETTLETPDAFILMDGVEIRAETLPALRAARESNGGVAASAKLGSPDGLVVHAGYDFSISPAPQQANPVQYGYWSRNVQQNNNGDKNTVTPTHRFQGLSLRDPRVNNGTMVAKAAGFACALVNLKAFLDIEGGHTGYEDREFAEVSPEPKRFPNQFTNTNPNLNV